MRLKPPAFIVGRCASRPTDLASFRLPAGMSQTSPNFSQSTPRPYLFAGVCVCVCGFEGGGGGGMLLSGAWHCEQATCWGRRKVSTSCSCICARMHRLPLWAGYMLGLIRVVPLMLLHLRQIAKGSVMVWLLLKLGRLHFHSSVASRSNRGPPACHIESSRT